MGWNLWTRGVGLAAVCALGPWSCDADAPGAESAAGSESSDGDTGMDEGCQPGGLMDPGMDVAPQGSISTSIALLTPGSDAVAGGPSVRFGLFGGEAGLPPLAELSGFANGCPIAQEPPEGEGGGAVFFHASGEDVPIEAMAGSRVTIEVRHGDVVLVRRTGRLPATLPELTSPARGAAVEGPITLAWSPLGLDELAAESNELGATAWIVRPSGSAGTDGQLELTDAAGTASWSGTHEWTHVQLRADIDYGFGFGLVVSHFLPVNPQ